MKLFLMLDDNNYRRNQFLAKWMGAGRTVTLAPTADLAIAALKSTTQGYDLVSLDHDLGEKQKTGMYVVNWITENRPEIKRVVVHSWNTPAAIEMAMRLQDAKYDVVLKAFDPEDYK